MSALADTGKFDSQYSDVIENNPSVNVPQARLFIAVLLNAVHDAVSSQSTPLIKRQALDWLSGENEMLDTCLSLTDISQDMLLRRVKYMVLNNINLRNMYSDQFDRSQWLQKSYLIDNLV